MTVKHQSACGKSVRLLIAGAALSWPLMVGGVAAAEDYPLVEGSLSAEVDGETSTSFEPGDAVSVAGGGFAPGAAVTITLHSTPVTLATTTASAAGAIDEDVVIPVGAAPGEHTIKATGASPTGGTTLLSLPVTIEGSASADGDVLAFTGADVAAITAIGGGAVIAGAGALVAVRRSRARG